MASQRFSFEREPARLTRTADTHQPPQGAETGGPNRWLEPLKPGMPPSNSWPAVFWPSSVPLQRASSDDVCPVRSSSSSRSRPCCNNPTHSRGFYPPRRRPTGPHPGSGRARRRWGPRFRFPFIVASFFLVRKRSRRNARGQLSPRTSRVLQFLDGTNNLAAWRRPVETSAGGWPSWQRWPGDFEVSGLGGHWSLVPCPDLVCLRSVLAM